MNKGNKDFEVYNHLPSGILIVNSNLQVLFTNQYFQQNLQKETANTCHQTLFQSDKPCGTCPMGHNNNDGTTHTQTIKFGSQFYKSICQANKINGNDAIITQLTEITPEVLLSKTVKRSKKKYKDIVNQGHSIIFRMKSDGEIIFSNRGAERLLGYKFDEFIGTNFKRFFASDCDKAQNDFLTEKNDSSISFEAKLMTKDKETLWLSWSLQKTFNRKGQFEEIIAIGTDISTKKAIEIENHNKGQLLKSIFNTVPTGIAYIKNNTFEKVNEQFTEITEHPEKHLLNKTPAMLFNSMSDYKQVFSFVNSYLNTLGTASTEAVIRCKSGMKKNVLLSAAWIDAENPDHGMVLSMLDITGLKAIEQSLRMHQQKLRNIIDAAKDAIIIIDAESGIIVDANNNVEQLIGKEAIELVGQFYTDIYPNELKHIARQNFKADTSQQRPRLKEISVLHNDGHWVPVEINSNVFRDDDQHHYVVGIYRDITRRKNNEEILKAKNEEIAHQVKELSELNHELVQLKLNKDEIYNKFSLAEKRYKQLFNAMVSGFALHKILYDDKGNPVDYLFIEVNPAFERLTGLKKENIINRTVTEVLPGTEAYWITNFGRVASKNETFTFKNQSREINKYFQGVAYSPEKDYFAVLFTDVTDSVKAEQALKEREISFKALTENSPDITMRFDNQLHILFISKSIERYVPIHKTDYAGKNIEELGFSEHESKYIQAILKKVLETGKMQETIFETTWNNQKITFNWRIVPEFNDENKIISLLSLARDITEQKQFEQDLILAKHRAEAADHLKTSFLANMSHEIRTPLNAIIGFTSLMENDTLEAEKRKRYIKIIKSRSDDLLHIISDILDISSIETGQVMLDCRNFSLNGLLSDMLSYYKQKLQILDKKTVSVGIEIPDSENDTMLHSDMEKIRQVISNLLDNALKFTLKGKVVFGYQAHPQGVEIFISDTGIGIEEEKIELIFERFRQAEDTLTRSFGGNGLGLAICKSFVHLLGGKIWVKSTVGKGSTFYFTVPLKSNMENDSNKLRHT